MPSLRPCLAFKGFKAAPKRGTKQRTRRRLAGPRRALTSPTCQEVKMANERLCSIPDCGKPSRAKGYCSSHWYKWKHNGDPLLSRKPEKQACTVSGCGDLATGKGYCRNHYYKFKRYGDPLGSGSKAGMPAAFIENLVSITEGEDCVLWPFSQGKGSRPTMRLDGRTRNVCRVICERIHGPPPSPSHYATHSCGKGHHGCVAPYHLRWGTPAENSAEMFIHGTAPIGEKSSSAKLTRDEVKQIRDLRGTMPQSALAKIFGVSGGTISRIQTGVRWGWL